MSNWIHVAGIVRLDSFRGMQGYLKDGIKDDDYSLDDFYKVFGKECLFESPIEVWKDMDKNPNNYLPMGDEGSLQLTTWTNPKEYHSFSYVVSIFGDLRDHDNANDIIEWFKNKIKEIDEDNKNNINVRQACITAFNERNGKADWSYSWDDE